MTSDSDAISERDKKALQELLVNNCTEILVCLVERADSLVQLVESHRVFEQCPSESGLVVDVGDLLHWLSRLCLFRGKLSLKGSLLLLDLFQKSGRDGQEVATSQFGDLVDVSERSTHDNGIVSVLLVVVVDLCDGHDTGIFMRCIRFLAFRLLVPVENTTDKGADEGYASFSTSNSLTETKEKGQVAVDTVFLFQFTGSLNTIPSRGNLDQDSLLGDTLLLVELNEVLCLCLCGFLVE